MALFTSALLSTAVGGITGLVKTHQERKTREVELKTSVQTLQIELKHDALMAERNFKKLTVEQAHDVNLKGMDNDIQKLLAEETSMQEALRSESSVQNSKAKGWMANYVKAARPTALYWAMGLISAMLFLPDAFSEVDHAEVVLVALELTEVIFGFYFGQRLTSRRLR